MRTSCLLITVAAFTAGGCTTQIQTYPEAGLDQLSGAAYHLPELRYDLTYTDSISSCPVAIEIAGKTVLIGGVGVGRKAAVAASYVPGERIAIDHDALTSIMKTTKYGFETYDSGIVKSVNSGAEDQTGPLLKSVVSIALSAYGLANPVDAALDGGEYGVSSASPFSTYGHEYSLGERDTRQSRIARNALKDLADLAELREIAVCKADVIPAFAAVKAKASLLDKQAAELETLNAEVDAVKLAVASRAANHDDLKQLVDAMKLQSQAKTALSEQKSEVEKAKASLTVTEEVQWTPGQAGWDKKDEMRKLFLKLEASRTAPVLLDIKIAEWWNALPPETQLAVAMEAPVQIKAMGLKAGEKKDCGKCEPAPTLAALMTTKGTTLRVVSMGAEPLNWQDATHLKNAKSGRISGLVVREPLPMRLYICKLDSDKPCEASIAESVSAEQLIPQAGPYRLLPFTNGPFEAATLSASFRENGRMESFSYERTKAASSGADAIAEAMTKVEAFKKEREKEGKDKLTEARADDLAVITHQIAMLTKQKELVALQSSPSPNEQQLMEAETARLNAEIALLNARRSRIEAEALLLAAAAGGQ